MNTLKRTISCKEAALLLGISQMMTKSMVKKGMLPGTVIETPGKRDRIIIPRAKFDEYMGETTQKQA